MQTLTPWHRLFGIALTDLFAGRPWRVEVEKELALRSQRLDILLIERRAEPAAASDPAALADLSDGLESLAAHNLLTYKSQHQPLDAWAVEELIGHYVAYRKLISHKAVQARTAANAALAPDQADAAAPPIPAARLPPEGDFLTQLYLHYLLEIPEMAYTIDDLHRDTRQLLLDPEARRMLFDLIPPEERLRGLDPEERLRGLDPEERLRGLDPEQVKAWLKRTGH
jgi:hypothetical protein